MKVIDSRKRKEFQHRSANMARNNWGRHA